MNTKPTAKVSIAVGADLFLSRPVPPDQVQQLQRLMSGMINECLDDIVEVMVGQGVLKPVKKT